MARVSTRVGWGRSSATGLAVAVFNVFLAVILWRSGYAGASLLFVGFASLSTFFALVHPHRVLELDDDDGSYRKVGDLVDDD
jgi:hypothetical protein